MDPITAKEIGRFFDKVETGDPDDCWPWKGARGGIAKKYGYFRFRGKMWTAHRVAWMLANGPIPEGMFVCHFCDTPLCTNPGHLWCGSHGQNMRDMVAKGWYRKDRTWLTDDQAKTIYESYFIGGWTYAALAAEFDVTPGAVAHIVRGRRHKKILCAV